MKIAPTHPLIFLECCSSLYADEIAGDLVMDYVISVIFRVQELIGGRVVFVECQDKPKLIDFYSRNGFRVFRQDPNDKLIQMVRLLQAD